MNKKTLFIIIGAGLLSFSIMFGVFFFVYNKTKTPDQEDTASAVEEKTDEEIQVVDEFTIETNYEKFPSDSLTEKQLKSLIIDLKEKRKEYQKRSEELKLKEERLMITQDTLKSDIERLEQLKQDLVNTIADYKIQENSLNDSILKIQQIEKDNITWRAAVYDKMDSTAASDIFIDMVANNQIDDAAKIIHYMSERTAAKLLAAIADQRSDITTAINLKLKRIKELEQ